MKKAGIVNRDISDLLSYCGHTDEFVISDIGLPLPQGVRVIDVSIKDNVPTVFDVADMISEHFSVEKIIFSSEAKASNPTHCQKIIELFEDVEVEYMPHNDFKKRTTKSKGIIRTGDYTAWGNVILVSGSGDKWLHEKD
jgi:D-ribose pyranase